MTENNTMKICKKLNPKNNKENTCEIINYIYNSYTKLV